MKIPFLAMLITIAVVIAVVSGFVAFYPLFVEATNSSRDSADSYAQEVSTKVSIFVKQLLSSATTYTAAVQRAFRLGAAVRTNNNSIVEWVCDFVKDAPLIYIIYYTDTTGFLFGRVNTLNATIPQRANNTIVSYYSGSIQQAEFRYIPDGNVTFNNPPDFVQTTSFNHSTRPYTPPMMTKFGWIPPFVDYTKLFADFGIGGPLVDPVSGQTYAIYGAFFRAVSIIDYFKSLTVAKTGQAFLIEASTQKYIGGTSADPSVKTVVVNGVSSTVLATPADVKDPICARAISALGPQLYTCLSCSMRVGSGSDMLFVSVDALQDSIGLDLRIVVVIPSDDFLGPINSGMQTGVASAGGAIGGFLLLVALALHLLLVPLKRLEERLYATSSLEVESEDSTAESVISEISNIQSAAVELQRELKKVKAFLPQSVLRRLELGDDADDEVEAESESNSTAVTGSVTRDLPTPKAAAESSMRRGSTATSRLSGSSEKGLGKRAGKGGVALYEVAAMRRVTVLSVNLGGFLKTTASASPTEIQCVLARIMDSVLTQVNAAKGVVESVSGDRFLISLNASTACGTHASKAAGLILALTAQCGAGKHGADMGHTAGDTLKLVSTLMANIQIGCATANSLCGNFGTDRLRRFSILGSVIRHASTLMKKCPVWGVPAAVASGSTDLMALEYDMQHIALELLPHAPVATIVSTVVAKRESADDEWMYQLKDKSQPSSTADSAAPASVEKQANQFFELLAEGKDGEAQQLLQSMPTGHILTQRCSASLK